MTFTLYIIRMEGSDQNVMHEKEVWSFILYDMLMIYIILFQQSMFENEIIVFSIVST